MLSRPVQSLVGRRERSQWTKGTYDCRGDGPDQPENDPRHCDRSDRRCDCNLLGNSKCARTPRASVYGPRLHLLLGVELLLRGCHIVAAETTELDRHACLFDSPFDRRTVLQQAICSHPRRGVRLRWPTNKDSIDWSACFEGVGMEVRRSRARGASMLSGVERARRRPLVFCFLGWPGGQLAI
jgi:hypothetical protein